jgi:hypothetical protein
MKQRQRPFVTDDLEWPSEVPKSTTSISDVEDALTILKLTFSRQGIYDVLDAIQQYPLDKYNEKNKPKKNEKRKTLIDLRSSALNFRENLHDLAKTDSDPLISEIYIAVNSSVNRLIDRLDSNLKYLTTKGQGIGGGAPSKVAVMRLVQRLSDIYKKETRQRLTALPGDEDIDWARIDWGRVVREINPCALSYLSSLIGVIDRELAKDSNKIIRMLTKKRYMPGIDIS